MKASKKIAKILAILITCLMVLESFTVVPISAQQGPQYGGTIRVGVFEEPSSVNVLSKERWINYMTTVQVYDTLFTFDPDFNIVPRLVTKYETSPDSKTWTFHIVQNATWHDGQPLTTADAKFTIEYLQKGQFGWTKIYVNNIASVETPDNATLVLHYKTPYTKAPYDFSSYSVQIMPEHIWKDIPVENALTYTNIPMVGSGPWKFDEYKTGQYIRFVANDKYWGGRPYLDTMVWQFFNDKAVAVEALKTGQVDLLPRDITPTLVKSLESAPDIKVWINNVGGENWRAITFNCAANGTGNPTLRDPQVRYALSISIDRQQISNVVHLGLRPAWAVFSLHPNLLDEKLSKGEFNLTKAAAILDAAGYKVSTDGIRVSPSGVKLDYQFLVVRKWSEEVRSAEMIKDWWHQIGVNIREIRLADAGTLDSMAYPHYSYDMWLWGWNDRPDPYWVTAIFRTDQITTGMNEWGYSNPEYDALQAQLTTETDPVKIKDGFLKLQEMIYYSAPVAILTGDATITAYNIKKFSGYSPAVGGLPSPYNLRMSQVYSLTIAPATTSAATTAVTVTGTPLETLSSWLAALVVLMVVAVGVAYIARKRKKTRGT